MYTAWKVSKYGVISGPYFPFSPNTGKHGPAITPCLDTFHAVVKHGGIFKASKILTEHDLSLQN